MKLVGIVGPRSTIFSYFKQLRQDIYKFITLDKNESISILKHCDIIINLASYTDVSSANDNREECWNANVTLVKDLLYLCKTYNISLLHFSTLALQIFKYDTKNNVTYFADGWSYYATTKFIGEQVLMASDYSNWAIARIDTVFGKNAIGRDQKFVGKMIKLMIDNKYPTLIDVRGIRPTYAKHVAFWIDDILKKYLYHVSEFNRDLFQPCNSILPNEIVTLEDYYNEICHWTNYDNYYKFDTSIKIDLGENFINSGLPHWREALKEYIENEI